ncbi:hypothetical protein STRIP9103_09350 [Streptomyces ipomoeae 91-03]|uniref:Uncharacterized protein n=1 Tax=Streptomyces ipomoeae 91-03 TaxID=698759 RepID=L1KJ16_9ACTN|nr:hypothetical protein STRIP9103_09350 [Streptomyces ipomoeae 91-03]
MDPSRRRHHGLTTSHDSPTSHDFPLGGDLPVNRSGFGAMRLSANGMIGPARDPKPVAPPCAAPSSSASTTSTPLPSTSATTAPSAPTGPDPRGPAPLPGRLRPRHRGQPVAHPRRRTAADHRSGRPAADDRGELRNEPRNLGIDRLDLVSLRIGMPEPPHDQSVSPSPNASKHSPRPMRSRPSSPCGTTSTQASVTTPRS